MKGAYIIKRLYLSTTDKKLAGVCGGIADYFSVDSTIIRLGWIVMTVLTGIFPGIGAYIVAAIFIPTKGEQSHEDSGEQSDAQSS